MSKRPTHPIHWLITPVTCFSIVLMLVWSPWLTSTQATHLVNTAFDRKWHGIADGCSLGKAGIQSVRRVALGYTATIEYACGMLPSNSPEFYRRATVYVSPLATVHGLP